MASITQGDLFPALRGYAKDQNGLVDLTAADSLQLVIWKTSTVILVVPTAIALPGELDDDGVTHYNWKYEWVSGDTDITGTYQLALRVTWPTSKPQYFPNSSSYPSLTILPNPNPS